VPHDEAERQIKIIRQQVKAVEEEVAKLEKEKAALEEQLGAAETYNDPQKAEAAQAAFTRIATDLEAKNSRWEELMLAIEDLSEE
jgi:septal ring factor EnvC (AmiA/AmiB activator)